jgi:hypothetical protein
MKKFNFISQETNLLTYLLSNSKDSTKSDMDPFFISKTFGDTYENLVKGQFVKINKEGILTVTKKGYKALIESAQSIESTELTEIVHDNNPQNCINFTSQLFARALGLLLQENQGIVVDIKDDIKMDDPKIKSVIVSSRDGQIYVTINDENIEEGKYVFFT